ncbi:MAG: (4Fe-4S)-binding protein [Chitinophagaceae bacterium]|nr:(4Fe-4S)-binding protein [Chitinophagaceae bacterium]
MPLKTLHYTNGETTIVWKPDVCIHSGICAKGLGEVFDPRRRPWIDMSQSDTQRIIGQVKKCPSGALSIAENDTDK